MFVELKNDGYSLSTQRKKIEGNEIPELTKEILSYKNDENYDSEKLLIIDKNKIASNDYSFDINRYTDKSKGIVTNSESSDEIIKKISKNQEEFNTLLKEIVGDIK